MPRTTAGSTLAIFFFLCSWTAPAEAYERGRPWKSDRPWEKFSVTVAFFLTNFSGTVSLTGRGSGVFLDLEDALGLDSTTQQFRLGVHYRAWRRHHFYFQFYDLSRDAAKILEVSIPEEDIDAGALVQSKFDLKIYRVGYSYSFWNDDRIDLGVGLGFHVMDLGVGLDVLAEGSAGGEQGTIDERLLAEATTLPLPVLALRGSAAVTKRVFIKQTFDVFYIDLPGFKGLLLDTNIALEGHITRFFGLGLAFNFLRVQIEGDGGDAFLGGGWSGKLDFDYAGVSLYGKFFF